MVIVSEGFKGKYKTRLACLYCICQFANEYVTGQFVVFVRGVTVSEGNTELYLLIFSGWSRFHCYVNMFHVNILTYKYLMNGFQTYSTFSTINFDN